jgi:hypothetical protein
LPEDVDRRIEAVEFQVFRRRFHGDRRQLHRPDRRSPAVLTLARRRLFGFVFERTGGLGPQRQVRGGCRDGRVTRKDIVDRVFGVGLFVDQIELDVAEQVVLHRNGSALPTAFLFRWVSSPPFAFIVDFHHMVP